ncbi:hypothetical protein [Chitinophaga nivalis]|uniref:LysM domain-containing protein n=1 Tax=Chitinophaga nivalis TaxID=2991709 RepID=A0ABT3INB9_9BACT|nr:hypothetical protein [Chitinophaga nivalis]MCW3464865.1 hypothetical protein [Chitinophaga nivalis]MCW3485444.1 hypothetical protein [Chitinophaga nivalis]
MFPPFDLVNNVTTTKYRDTLTNNLAAWAGIINQQATIRIVVDGTPGYGHQASSINILRRITGAPNGLYNGFGYSGAVEIWYDYDGTPELEDPLPKILSLLPELKGQLTGRLDGATVAILNFDKVKPAEQVLLAFTGGWDLVQFNLNEDYKSSLTLILQPFNYEAMDAGGTQNLMPGNNLQVSLTPDNKKVAKINLDDGDTKQLLIKDRAYFLPVKQLVQADWDYYKGPDFSDEIRRRVEAIEYFLSGPVVSKIAPTLTYGINYPKACAFAKPTHYRIFLEMAAVRTALENAALHPILPPLILNFGNYQPEENFIMHYNNISYLLKGGLTIGEQLARAMSFLPDATRLEREAWTLKKLNWENRKRSINFQDVDTQYLLADYLKSGLDVKEVITWVTGAPRRVLFLQMGFVPPLVFNYYMSKVKLPPVFEGPNTAVVAINTGNPYFNANRPGGKEILYPTGLLGGQNILAPVKKLQSIADQIESSLDTWPTIGKDAPTLIMGNSMNEMQVPGNPYLIYFGALKQFYSQPDPMAGYNLNDKFNVALGAAYQMMRGFFVGNQQTTQAAADDDPLTVLYEKLQAAAATGEVDLLDDIFPEGNIHDFYTSLLADYGGTLIITSPVVEAVQQNGITESVTLTGSTRAFGLTTTAKFLFTLSFGDILSSARFTAGLPWNLGNIPWIIFESPFLQARISEGDLPPATAIGGKIKGKDFELMMDFPIAEDRILIRGEFEQLKTIADFFSIAGGVNLLQYIPGPFQALAGLGIKYMEFAYNKAQTTIDYISFNVKTATPWNFFDVLQLEDIDVVVSVRYPASLAERETIATMGAKLRLGTGDTDPRLEVAATVPDLVLRGQLYDPTLPINKLINIFWPGLQPGWPGGKEPVVTDFSFNYAMNTGDYAVLLQLELKWPLTVAGTTIFQIESVGMTMNGTDALRTGSLNGSLLVLPDSDRIGLTLTADYLGANNGWRFMGQQTSGTVDLVKMITWYLPADWRPDPEVFSLQVDGLGITVITGSSSWEFTAKTASAWVTPLGDFTGDMKIGYNGKATTTTTTMTRVPLGTAAVPLLLDDKRVHYVTAVGMEMAVGYYGTLNARIRWNNIELTIFYNFDPTYKSYGISWGILTGKIEEKIINNKLHKIATLGFNKPTTLGSIVETMISWATGTTFGLSAPWSILNSIPLNKLQLVYDFTDNKVSFEINIGPINMGFARIEAISVSYVSGAANPEDNGVIVELKGSFFWQSNPGEPQKWNAAKPETTPAPSGQGNKYLDLRLLAMGQHVTLDCFRTADKVQDAIACMAKLPDTKDGEIPAVQLDANSSWLTGMDFGILKLEEGGDKEAQLAAAAQYFLTLQVVFNDPNLYALRIALEGTPAKIFKGLDFQIMYKKISESVGVYQAEIALPDVMRKIKMGQFNITLPVFGIAIYTNGDFQVDIGFPWKADFSRSFTFQTLIWTPIGIPIPVMGSVGLYFGKLSSATTNRVPKIDNGTFNPVLVFGFGIQFGFGYDFDAGILKAGFSLTAVAILEGILAKFNPYQPTNAIGTNNQLETSYYFWFRGTVGIIGKLYGSIDFKIIKAELNIDIRLLVQMTFAPYEYIELSITASVDVSLSVSINLGIFKIKIHLSFSARIQQGITIRGIGGTPPWHVVGKPAARISAPLLRRGQLSYERQELLAALAVFNPVWSNLQAPATPVGLTGYMGVGLTMAGDIATQLADQVACYVAMLFLESPQSATADRVSARLKAYADAGDTSFETLCKQIFRWAIASLQSGPVSGGEVDTKVVTDLQLVAFLAYLNDENLAEPIPATAISSFMTGQFSLTVQAPSADVNAVYFPVPPELTLSVPAYGTGYKGVSYTFGGYNNTASGYTKFLRTYFNDLAVQVAPKTPAAKETFALNDTAAVSVGSFIFGDYFVLICRQMLQAARDALRDYKYNLIPGQSTQGIVDQVHKITHDDTYTLAHLFTDNATAALNTNKTLQIAEATYLIQAGDTFDSIAALPLFGKGFTGSSLATANAATLNILQAGVIITYPGKDPYTTLPGQSLQQVADSIGVSVSDLIQKGNITTLADLLLPVATLEVPVFGYNTAAGDNLQTIAAKFNITLAILGTPTANGAVTDLFDSNASATIDIAMLSQMEAGELIREIQATHGLQYLAGMSSRYYMAGLRLPTEGVTPNYPGMWVTGNAGDYKLPSYAGLYALTGQQFPIPALTGKDPFNITFTNTGGPGWLQFAGTDKTTLTISIAPDSVDAKRINSVRTYATGNNLDTGLTWLGAQEVFSREAATYPFTTAIAWNSAASVPMPYGGTAPGVPALTIWPLPDTLLQLPDRATRKTDPRVQLLTGRFDEATRTMKNTPVQYYGYGSLVAFTIKRVPLVPDSPNTAYTYEVMGADGSNVAILEKMVSGIGTDNSLIHTLTLAYPVDPNGTTTNGIQTDVIDSLTIGIAQVNLSTETRPDAAAKAVVLAQEEIVLLNQPADFIRLLWQAGITRGGGYYLYYYNSESDRGLPDRIFNDRDEAVLSLVVLYTAPDTAALRNNVTAYMNTTVTGEAIDTTNTVVFTQADPYAVTIAANSSQTLAALAYDYYGNVADVAADNTTLTLRSTIVLQVKQGVYEVGPAGSTPGGNLAAIAAWFGTTDAAIKAANPQITDWQTALPLYTALYLPDIPVTVGTSKGGTTLESIAAYYGTSLTVLADSNQLVAGIFADGGNILVSGGPVTRTATVPAGVAGLEAVRPVPAPIPDDPAAADYGKLFLQHTYNLLSYQLAANAFFNSSSLGLPASPLSDAPDAGDDKIRYARELEVGDDWEYTVSVPYSRFAKQAAARLQNLPDPAESPYRGLGKLLQADFAWQDLYGNRLFTDLSNPVAGSGAPLNQPPVLTGYTDPIIGLNQWPSIATSWEVNNGNGTTPQVQLNCSFSDSYYQGLLRAKATGTTTLQAQFTTTLDPATATDVNNYQLDAQIVIKKVTLDTGNAAVTLEVDNIPQDKKITLTINGISNADKTRTYSGNAQFTYPDIPEESGSSLIQQAQQDLQVYRQLYFQLTDPNGIAYTVSTTLLQSSYTLTATQTDALVQTWLVSIYQFLADRAQGLTTVPPPAAWHLIQCPIVKTNLNTAQLFRLDLDFIITRTGGAVAGDFATTGGIRTVAAAIAPLTAGDSSDAKSLNVFAARFEAALTEKDKYVLKVATGNDRLAPAGKREVWAVRLGLDKTTALGYQINDKGNPALFAPRPISNKLESRHEVPVYAYSPETGIDFSTPSTYMDFMNIDMDQWGQQFLTSVDGVLAPEFTAAIQLVDQKKGTGYLQDILENKTALANIIQNWMIPVLAGETPDATNVQETFRQLLLVKLSNAYNTQAAVQFNATVTADKPVGIAPRLFGNFTRNFRLVNAAVQQEEYTVVYLYFTTPPDPLAASNVANYTVSGSLSILTAAVDTSNTRSVILTLDNNVTVDTTEVTVSNTLRDVSGQLLLAPYTRKVTAVPDGGNNSDTLIFTASRLALRPDASVPLPFLITAPQLVRGTDNEILPYADLDLTYAGSAIEQQISTLPNIEGYEASSWLSFVIAAADSPLAADLERFQVPMILRAFPAAPAMVKQNGEAQCPPDASRIGDMLNWGYIIQYSLPVHYPQDEVDMTIDFNVADNGNMKASEMLDAFPQLAEFITVYPDVNKVLNTQLTQITASTPANDPLLETVSIALTSFLEMVQHIVAASEGNAMAMSASLSRFSSTEALPYSFFIRESSADIQSVKALVVTIYGKPPAGVGKPEVRIAGYKAQPLSQPCGGDYCYYYEQEGTGTILKAADGQVIQDRTVVIPEMNLLARQDALTTATLKRNAELIPGKPSSEPFIYTAGPVSFANPYHPAADCPQLLNIAAINSGSSGYNITTLAAQLTNLFDALLKENSQDTISVLASCLYTYQLNDGMIPVSLPVMMQPMESIWVKDDTGTDKKLSAMIRDWADSILLWAATLQPVQEAGTLCIDLTLFSNLTAQPLPLIRLRNLVLEIQYVTDWPS